MLWSAACVVPRLARPEAPTWTREAWRRTRARASSGAPARRARDPPASSHLAERSASREAAARLHGTRSERNRGRKVVRRKRKRALSTALATASNPFDIRPREARYARQSAV